MLKTNGFVDLRVGHGAAGIGDDSVWPSFTDVMTVIVMIFLMTLVVIMVRNFGLSSELLTNISAREAAMLANQDLTQKNTELEASLQSAEAERTSLAASLTQALERIASLADERLELQADLESMTVARQELEQASEELQQTQVATSVKVEGLIADTEVLMQQKADLEAALRSAEVDRASLRESLARAQDRIALLGESERGLQDEVALLTVARQELEQASEELQQTQIATSVKVEGLIADTEVLMQQKADLEAALRSAEADRASLRESLARAQDEVALLIAARQELEQANEELQQAQLETSVEIENLIADTEDLRQQKAYLEAALRSAEAQSSALAESLEQALGRIASLTESERGLQDEVTRLTANELLLTRNISALDETLAELEVQSETEIASLIDERATLEDRLHNLSGQLEHLKRLLSRSNLENQLLIAEMEQVERINESAAARYARVTDEVLSLKELIEQREVEIASLRASADTSAQQYKSLQEEYESLDAQYRKLIRPARSPVGKIVAEVHVEKTGGALSYRIKQPGDSALVPVSRGQLDSMLQDLKDRLGESLYTRIVIPDDSNLTFNEAWGFTWEILRKYDYYYQ